MHRIGRTGRAGNSGIALTFITPREFRQLKLIERSVKTKITRRQLPTDASVLERQREMIVSKMQTVLEQNKFEEYMSIVDSLTSDYNAEEIAAAALKLMQEGNKALEASESIATAHDFTNTGAKSGMVRLFINIGRSQKVMPKDLVRAIAIECDIPGNTIGQINIYDKFSFIEVPAAEAERVLAVMHRNTIKGYKVNMEPAKGR